MNDGTLRLMIYKIIQNKIEREGFAQIKVNGGSMLPTLLPRDIVIIKPLSEYCCGDILVFYSMDGRIIVHRLIKRCRDFYITKGDNNLFYDEKVPKYRILGKVISWSSNGYQYIFTNNFFQLKSFLYLSKGEVLLSSNKMLQKYLTESKNKLLKISKVLIGSPNIELAEGQIELPS